MQQGRYAGHVIHRLVTGKPAPKPFRYFDKGTMAVVGLGYAVLQTGRLHLKGYVAWLAWAVVHVLSLAQPALRISVFSQWVWTYFTRQRGSWLIVNPHGTASASRTSETPACEVTPRET
jgi:NADH dehydrogenase FAD-containing subunit